MLKRVCVRCVYVYVLDERMLRVCVCINYLCRRGDDGVGDWLCLILFIVWAQLWPTGLMCARPTMLTRLFFSFLFCVVFGWWFVTDTGWLAFVVVFSFFFLRHVLVHVWKHFFSDKSGITTLTPTFVFEAIMFVFGKTSTGVNSFPQVTHLHLEIIAVIHWSQYFWSAPPAPFIQNELL